MTQLEMMTSTEFVGQGNVFDFALEELDVFDAGLALVLAGEGEHVVGHVEAVGLAGGSDAFGGEQHVDAAAGAEVEDDFAGLEIDERGGIAAAERCVHSLFRQGAAFRLQCRGLSVMGSQQLKAGLQQATEPACCTERAAAPYLSWTRVLVSVVVADIFPPHIRLDEYMNKTTYLSKRICGYNRSMVRGTKSFDMARLFAALADPTRLRLLNLMAGREVCVCYFVEILKLGQPKISRHLAYLRSAGIVSARREGKWMHYSIQCPEDAAARAILELCWGASRRTAEMQTDLSRLDRACCEPQRLVALQDAPVPVLFD